MRVPSMGAEGPLEEGNPFFPAESHEQRSLRVTESDKTEVTEYTCTSWGLGAEKEWCLPRESRGAGEKWLECLWWFEIEDNQIGCLIECKE